jgi:hypothetical protein
VTKVHADIDALKGLHEALARFRQVLREVADRGEDQIEAVRVSLEARAGHCRFRLEQCQAELDACRADDQADCSGYARAVAQAAERLEHVRYCQMRVDQEAGEFRGTAGRFRDLLETDLPRAEQYLLAVIASLQAARRVAAPDAS